MLAGLEEVDEGAVFIGAVTSPRSPEGRDIAMVFQSYALYPHMTVADNMGFALKLAACRSRRSRRRSPRRPKCST
jgi:multiple sugar transport system ATP-binding protein